MRLPTKRATLTLTKDFEGLEVGIRGNLLVGTLEDIAALGTSAKSSDLPKLRVLLASITLDSNLQDDHDQPIDLTTADGWRQVTAEFIGEVMERLDAHLDPPKATSTGSETSSSSETPSTSPSTTP